MLVFSFWLFILETFTSDSSILQVKFISKSETNTREKETFCHFSQIQAQTWTWLFNHNFNPWGFLLFEFCPSLVPSQPWAMSKEQFHFHSSCILVIVSRVLELSNDTCHRFSSSSIFRLYKSCYIYSIYLCYGKHRKSRNIIYHSRIIPA